MYQIKFFTGIKFHRIILDISLQWFLLWTVDTGFQVQVLTGCQKSMRLDGLHCTELIRAYIPRGIVAGIVAQW